MQIRRSPGQLELQPRLMKETAAVGRMIIFKPGKSGEKRPLNNQTSISDLVSVIERLSIQQSGDGWGAQRAFDASSEN